jgi:D-amino-acid dehydrogenase
MRIIVVGAGLMGTTTAWYLQEAGASVTLIDRAPSPACGTSAANGGMLHASHAEPWNAPGVGMELLRQLGREDSPLLLRPQAIPGLIRWGLQFLWHSRRAAFHDNTRWNGALAAYSLRELRHLQDRLDLVFDFRPSGILKIFRDQQSYRFNLAGSQAVAASGVRFEEWTADRMLAAEPLLAPIREKLVGGLFFPDDAVGDAAAFTRALAQKAISCGLRWLPGTEAIKLRYFRGRINGLETSEGPIAADVVVIASGHESARLLRPIGLDIGVAPVKGYSLTLNLPDAELPRLPLIDDAGKVVMTTLGSRLRIAGTAELAGANLTLQPQRSLNVLHTCRKTLVHLPADLDSRSMQPWAGLRPVAARGRPILGATPIPGLFLNVGAGHLGWTFSCGAACVVRDAILGRRSEIATEAFRL